MKTKAGLFALLALIVFAGGACGREDSAINEIGLIYSGGLTEDKEFKGILKPGSTWNSVGVGSSVYKYRIDQRSYIANDKQNGADEAPVVVVSKDGVRMKVSYELYFTLNQDEDTIRKFHENIGVKTEAWKNDGWIEMLQTYFAPHIERSMEAAALQHDWQTMYRSEDGRRAFEGDTVSRLKTAINDIVGDEYFCGPSYQTPEDPCGDFTFTVGKPEPVNGDIIAALEAEQKAAQATIAQQQENARVDAQLEAERAIVELYGPQAAVVRKAIESGQVQFMVIPEGANVSVPRPE